MISLQKLWIEYLLHIYKPAGGEKDNAQSFNYTLTLPFVPEFSENLKRELQKQRIWVAFKRGQTLESML